MTVVDLSWSAAVWGPRDTHEHKDQVGLRGSAVLVTPRLLVTCAHVAVHESDGEAGYVSFPHDAEGWEDEYQVIVRCCRGMADVALLELDRDAPVAPAVVLASPPDEIRGAWSAWGYRVGDSVRTQDPDGRQAGGDVVGALPRGKVQLRAAGNTTPPVEGFSGTGIWSHDAGPAGAVVAILSEVEGHDAKAISLKEVARNFPAELQRLTTPTVPGVDASARAAWRIADDADYLPHWDPRSRGMTQSSQQGNRFQGRTAALEEINEWLADPSDRRCLVVTGSPGVGKSAVLGRVVTTADPVVRRSVPDEGVFAHEGSVTVAVHAKRRTPEEVARKIADAAYVDLPDDVGDLPAAIAEELDAHPRPFTVVIDAVDEAHDTHRLVGRVLFPLIDNVSDEPLRVLVGTRRRDRAGELLTGLGTEQQLLVIDLDEPRYFEFDDLVRYSLATLQMQGSPHPRGVYQALTDAYPVAERIAWLAEGNFLVGGLLALRHGLGDREPATPEAIRFEGGKDRVARALMGFLEDVEPVAGLAASDVLTALAYAEAPGFPLELWQVALHALFEADVPIDALETFCQGSAGNFLIEASTEPTANDDTPRTAYRLFHEALNETLLEVRR